MKRSVSTHPSAALSYGPGLMVGGVWSNSEQSGLRLGCDPTVRTAPHPSMHWHHEMVLCAWLMCLGAHACPKNLEMCNFGTDGAVQDGPKGAGGGGGRLVSPASEAGAWGVLGGHVNQAERARTGFGGGCGRAGEGIGGHVSPMSRAIEDGFQGGETTWGAPN